MSGGTAIAHPNIALVKYWGKADATQNLPATGSLSMTLDVFPTTTTVTLDPALTRDEFVFNGTPTDPASTPGARVARFLDLVRERAGSAVHARVVSDNTVPSAAGLASSASGFAALAAAASHAYGLPSDEASLSRLARRGSGSASRSILPGFAVWSAGDDETSFAEAVPAEDAAAEALADLAMVIAVVARTEKPVSSREAMRATIETSPFYPAWVSSTAATLDDALAACAAGDIDRLGAITETNALRMHALIQSCDPPIRYLTPRSVAIFDEIAALRAAGTGVWGTADAGPNVVALCRAADVPTVEAALAPLAEIVIARPGPGVRVMDASLEAHG
ncbi:diphosphomevalonate decarboxylase [uncultured Microbacterium sp.]|uniref:diphosphomevalonate decarboxylase n=1 Tax=uncultured Microbacterium sp. TaxID=191216 RepID=UPI0025FEB1D3|nr:diphosphomevalonate decarboxylase [uncultured Microbacterium sp.]